ncbi:MAG: hypothetical protein K9G11_04675 [Rickettsiaceae bacterium]|nr:hypothetical protein [Rickettsiaceae bacterium]
MFALDCHALQARNDTCALPLEDVAFLCIRIAGMPISLRSLSSRSLLMSKEPSENNVLL